MGDRTHARIMLPLWVYEDREEVFDAFFEGEGFYLESHNPEFGHVVFRHDDANFGGETTWDNLTTGILPQQGLIAYMDWGHGGSYSSGKRVYVCGNEAEALTDEANTAYAKVLPDGSIDEQSLAEARLFQRLNANFDAQCERSKKKE